MTNPPYQVLAEYRSAHNQTSESQDVYSRELDTEVRKASKPGKAAPSDQLTRSGESMETETLVRSTYVPLDMPGR